MKLRNLLLVTLALLLIGTLALAEAAGAQVGDECPDFELTTLTGDTFRLSDCRGKAVFINIWATWCPPCRAEMGDIDRLAATYPDELAVIGVSIDELKSTVEDFIAENGYSYPIAMDDAGYTVSMKIFPSYYIPNSIFIDPNGVVTSIESGSADYDTLEQRFQDALAHGAES